MKDLTILLRQAKIEKSVLSGGLRSHTCDVRKEEHDIEIGRGNLFATLVLEIQIIIELGQSTCSQ